MVTNSSTSRVIWIALLLVALSLASYRWARAGEHALSFVSAGDSSNGIHAAPGNVSGNHGTIDKDRQGSRKTRETTPQRAQPSQESTSMNLAKKDEAEAHLNLGNLLVKQGKKKEAMTNFVEALRIRPNFAEAHLSIGDLFASQGKIDDAIAHYANASRLKPGVAIVHINLANMQTLKGRTAEAIRQYKDALRIDPKLWNAHYSLGILLAGQGNTTEAIKHYSEALRLKPDDQRIRASLEKALKLQKTNATKSPPEAK